jgi:hypothetical protein
VSVIVQPHSRFFLRHEIRFKPRHTRAKAMPFQSDDKFADVETVLKAAMKNGKGGFDLKVKDRVELTHLEVRAKDDLAILLFRRSDPNASTPIFENRTTKKLRPSDKKPDEAVAVSAHLFVKLGGIVDAIYRTYRAILEEVPGLGRTYIQYLLGSILREHKYGYVDKDEAKETYTVVAFHGLKSDSIGGALDTGSVSYVELVRPANVAGLDTEGVVVPRDERMRLTLQARPEQTLGVLRRIKAWAYGHKWTDVRVQVQMPEDRSRVVSLAREADAADVLFVRSVPVDLVKPLDVCTAVVSEELAQKAIELFAKDTV